MKASEIPPEAIQQAITVLAEAYVQQGLPEPAATDFATRTVHQAIEQNQVPGLAQIPAPASDAPAWPFPVKPQPDGGQ